MSEPSAPATLLVDRLNAAAWPTQEIADAVSELADAHFECGEWTDDEDESFEQRCQAAARAERRLLEALRAWQAEAANA